MAKSSMKKLRNAVVRTKRMFKVFTYTGPDKKTYIHIEN